MKEIDNFLKKANQKSKEISLLNIGFRVHNKAM